MCCVYFVLFLSIFFFLYFHVTITLTVNAIIIHEFDLNVNIIDRGCVIYQPTYCQHQIKRIHNVQGCSKNEKETTLNNTEKKKKKVSEKCNYNTMPYTNRPPTFLLESIVNNFFFSWIL